MIKTIINVEGMSCAHCVKAVNTAVSALEGVSSVDVELASKTVTVEHDSDLCSVDRIKAEIEDLGYDVV